MYPYTQAAVSDDGKLQNTRQRLHQVNFQSCIAQMRNSATGDPRKFDVDFGGRRARNQVYNTVILICKKMSNAKLQRDKNNVNANTSVEIFVTDCAVSARETAPTQENLQEINK